MGFLSGMLGTKNTFQATAPVNTFQAQGDYAPGIAQAQGGALDTSGQDQFIAALKQQMAGNSSSVAQQLLRQGTDTNNASIASAIASQRGMNPGMAQKLLLDRQAANGQQMAGQAATLRAQEMAGAQGPLAQALAQRQQGQLGALGALGSMQLGTQGINAGVASGNQQAQMDAQHVNAGVAAGNQQANSSLVGGLMGGLGAAGAAYAGAPAAAAALAAGGPVPGKAAVTGDSPKNDTVPAMLSPGEVVLPRSVADDPEKAAAFVRAIRRQKEPDGYGKALMRMREMDGRLRRVEALFGGGRVQ